MTAPVVVYALHQRPDVEVFVDGQWCPAELRMWQQHEDGVWWGQVTYQREPGVNRINTFHERDVRLDDSGPRPG